MFLELVTQVTYSERLQSLSSSISYLSFTLVKKHYFPFVALNTNMNDRTHTESFEKEEKTSGRPKLGSSSNEIYFHKIIKKENLFPSFLPKLSGGVRIVRNLPFQMLHCSVDPGRH